MAIAAITVMLWILWSDTIRSRRPSQVLYAVRIALYLVVAGVLTLNLVRYPHAFVGGGRALTIVAIATGILGAGYFARKLVRQSRSPH
ncbi:MAG TPA: hypothetical protein VNA69_17520 [Thermoanaerobaculia bacterium]|nr:hypothetical protein [Thermoanaerobaculia bacterium]